MNKICRSKRQGFEQDRALNGMGFGVRLGERQNALHFFVSKCVSLHRTHAHRYWWSQGLVKM